MGTKPKQNKALHLATVGIGLLLSNPAMADIEEDSLLLQLSGDEELISIATGTPRPVSKAPAVATVITATDIKASGAKTVQEVLERVPGLHIGASTINKIKPIFSFRGIHTANNSQTLILINGLGIPDLFNGGVLPRLHMPIENIARIEVIRGPGSAVYGADAFAGVINIITKTDIDINGFQTGVKAGTFGTRDLWGQYGGIYKGWHVALSSEYSSSNGDRSRIIDSDLQTAFDGISGTSASRAPGALDTRYESLVNSLSASHGNWNIQLNSWNQNDTGLGAGVANALDPAGYTNIEQYLFNIGYTDKTWRPDWSLSSNLSYLYNIQENQYNLFPAGTLLPIGSDGNAFTPPANPILFTNGFIGNPDGSSEVTQFNLTMHYQGMKAHQWRFNIGIKQEKLKTSETKNFGPGVIDGTVSPIDGTLTDVTGTPLIYHPGASRTVSYLSVQDEWSFARDWILTGGMRFDQYSDVGSTVNPRLSVVWNTRHNLTSKLLYGRAFRAPTFSETGTINNPIALGNPNLAPETIDTLELAFDYEPTDTLNLKFNLFHYHINGLINFIDNDGLPGGNVTAQNDRDQGANGFELETTWQANRQLRLFGSFALHNARDANSGVKVADTPRRQLHVGGNWRFAGKWSTQLNAFRIMDRLRAAGDTRPEIKDYTWVNLALNIKKYFQGIDLQLAIRNLTDTNAREPGPTSIPNDYPLEGRSIMLGVSVDIK
ncbi:MAG: TonB-dependent receptor [Gammaproteobacteria bacterium]|nr:TonB-dependent receptor [Gammaproteobacteria bacterium]